MDFGSLFPPPGGTSKAASPVTTGMPSSPPSRSRLATLSGDGVETHLHRERHYSVPEVQRTMMNSGLEPLAAMGHREELDQVVIDDGWYEERDAKIIYVAKLSHRSAPAARFHNSPDSRPHSDS